MVEFAWCLGVCCFVVFWFGLPAVGRLVLWFARWCVVCSLLGFCLRAVVAFAFGVNGVCTICFLRRLCCCLRLVYSLDAVCLLC